MSSLGSGAASLLEPWTGSYGGFPKFENVTVDNVREALMAAMEVHRKEIATITSNKDAATFENTLEALEDTGRAFNRVCAIYGIYTSSMNTKEFQALETEMEPKLAAFADELTQNGPLFQRIKAVYEGRDKASPSLSPEQLRLVTETYDKFVQHGANLNEAQKKELGDMNQRLASLYATFGQNILADEADQYLELTKEEELAGLNEDFRSGAKDAAKSKNKPDSWIISNTRSAMEPFLTMSSRRDLREKAFQLFVTRGAHDGAHDNRPIIKEILQLREKKAALLGHDGFAKWILSQNMAKTPETAMKLLQDVCKVAVQAAERDITEMSKLAAADGIAEGSLEPWDHRYYAEKLRKQKYDLDDAEVKPYLQLDKMLEGVMYAAELLHGLSFTPVSDVKGWHPDVRVFQVVKKESKESVGLFFLDPYAREGKRSGAWMCDHRGQEAFRSKVTPIISNNLNFIKSSEGNTLISWDDANTMFHEMGHALHGMLSNVQYPSLSGTNVRRDFVELPSQLNEHWLFTTEVLSKYARHYETNEPMPKALLDKIIAARNANEGFSTVEYLSSAIYDLAVHTTPATEVGDPLEFEKKVSKEMKLPRSIVLRHRPTHFQHIFQTEGYAAAYYAYMWADVLTADAAEAFQKAPGGFYDSEVAEKLRKFILTVGNSVDPAEAFRSFRGRDPDTAALLRKRGFA